MDVLLIQIHDLIEKNVKIFKVEMCSVKDEYVLQKLCFQMFPGRENVLISSYVYFHLWGNGGTHNSVIITLQSVIITEL